MCTYNFVDVSIASKCSLPIQNSQKNQVKVANGEILHSEGKCTSIGVQGMCKVSKLEHKGLLL